MAGTTLQDVIVPELFNPYVINRTMEISALVQCGIIANNTEFDALASQAAPTVNMPFFEDLTGESEQVIEGADLEDNKITSNKDVAAIIRRAKMWSATDLSAALAGSDPMAAIGSLVAGFWARDMQKELIALLEGVLEQSPQGMRISLRQKPDWRRICWIFPGRAARRQTGAALRLSTQNRCLGMRRHSLPVSVCTVRRRHI